LCTFASSSTIASDHSGKYLDFGPNPQSYTWHMLEHLIGHLANTHEGPCHGNVYLQFASFVLVIIAFIISAIGFMTLSNHPLSNESIEPAAEALMREHGAQAVSEAARQVSALNSKGFYALAATWQQIRHKIVERQQLEDLHVASK
jgi:hypothetical protein